MLYRREIDGLRAVAVLPVIFFHAGVSAFSGGFVGVDVFFVISGYLITSIIIDDLQSDAGFSIKRFYERRARRILPALYLVMIFSTVAAWFLLVPDQLENYGQSLVATTLFSNNLLLALTTGYWDVLTELKPLVHTWSLSVEEQFYVVFPLVLMLLSKGTIRRAVCVVATLALISLVAAEWGAQNIGSAHFYLPHTRAWELLAGALCAYTLKYRAIARNDFGAALGVAMIAYAVVAFNASTPFPSSWTLIPVIGTALVILFATGESAVGRLLSWRPLVGVGLISYSAYLWHQPIFAFARAYFKDRPEPMVLASLTPVVLLISYLSWRYVEAPFRDGKRVGLTGLLWFAAPISVAFLSIGLWFHQSDGVPARLFATTVEGARSSEYNPSAFRFTATSFKTDKPVKLLVIGDSFGRDTVNMVFENADREQIEIVYHVALDMCVPKAGRILKPLLEQSTVIIVSQRPELKPSCLDASISWASREGKQLFYLGPKSFGTNINWIARVPDDKRPLLLNTPDLDVLAQDSAIRNRLPAANYLSVMDAIMVGQQVPFTDNEGNLLSDDTQHLTKSGARFVGRRVLADSRLETALAGEAVRSAASPKGQTED
ncbi:MAG: acyltransferase [Sphingopyxis sp.]|uniref:acyltransferase family protein n=1 Tax=Sphingopyxis sp. TaxID=1908224 RepID=UPI003D81097F